MVIKCDKNYLRNKQIEISNVNFYKLVSSLVLLIVGMIKVLLLRINLR